MGKLLVPSLFSIINVVLAVHTAQGIHRREPVFFLLVMWAIDTICTGGFWTYLVLLPDTMFTDFFAFSLFVSCATCFFIPLLLKKGEFTGMAWMVARRYGLMSGVLLPSLLIASITALEWIQYIH